MTPAERKTIVVYRLERAEESLQAATLLLKSHLLIPAMNRVYYAMFYAVQALLAYDEVSFSKHGQVKGYFNREYIKTGVFPITFGKHYNTVFEYRQKFDYVDLVIPDETTVQDLLQEAAFFIQQIHDYILQQRDLSESQELPNSDGTIASGREE